MVRFNSSEIGVCQGSVQIVSDYDTGGPFWTGDGDRVTRHRVAFEERFVAPPAVQVTPMMWDIQGTTNIRGDLTVEDVTSAGFMIVFKTWGDSRIARMRVTWTAIGPLPDDDHFML